MNFTELRRACGFTQEQLAQMLEYSPRQISNWDNGHNVPPKAVRMLLELLLERKQTS